MSAAHPVVALDGAVRRFGGLTAVDRVSFELRQGELFGIIGPDGAGKTTTLRMVLGLLAPDAGTVRTFGVDPVRRARELSRRVGYLPQRFSLYGDLSVDENVAFFAQVHGVPRWRARRDELLEILRLAPFRTRLADRLSGGMKQKLALACNLIHTPELLVLDEPTTGVDPVSRRDFWKILSALERDGLTILLTTPYLDEAERCRRVALMSRGRLLSVDEPAALRASSGATIVEVLASPRRRAAELLSGMAGVADVQSFGERLHATVPGADPAAADEAARRIAGELAAAGIAVESVRRAAPSLEDVFIARIRDAESAAADREVAP